LSFRFACCMHPPKANFSGTNLRVSWCHQFITKGPGFGILARFGVCCMIG